MRKIRITRDGVIFVGGMAILFHEVVVQEGTPERPQLLIIAAMMIGLPAFLRKDETSSRPKNPEVVPPKEPDPKQG